MAVLQERYALEQDELRREHEVQAKIVSDREASLARQRALVEVQQRQQREREAKITMDAQKIEEANREAVFTAAQVEQRVREADEGGCRRGHNERMALTAAQVEQRVKEAVERGYQRGQSEASQSAPTRSAAPTHTMPEMRGTVQSGTRRVPSAKDGKISMRTFNGKELHAGLSAGFKHWGRGFKDEIDMAEEACGFEWSERYEISKLGSCLRGEAEEFFNGLRDEWWEIEPTLAYAMEEMESAFSRTFLSAQVSEFFKAKKSANVSWHAHYLYLMAVRNATGASAAMIPESLVLHACPELRPVLVSQYDKKRKDYVIHALEITQWAQTYEDSEKKMPRPAKVAAAIHRPEARECKACGVVGHLARNCTAREKKADDPNNPRWALSGVREHELDVHDWIVDSGCSTHLVRDKNMLIDWEDIDDPTGCQLPDGFRMRITRRVTARVRVRADGDTYWITLSDACYAPKLALNLISLGTLMKKGCTLGMQNRRHAILKANRVVVCIKIKNNVLVVDQAEVNGCAKRARDVVMSAVSSAAEPPVELQQGSLMHYHLRFGHLNFDDVERLARDPGNGIALTDHVRKKCLTCAEGKQTKAVQPKQNSGQSAPTDVVGAVICAT